MIDNGIGYWIKAIASFVLALLAICGLLGYYYIDIRKLYRNRENRWWIGLLATLLPLFSITMGLIIWTLWNPLVRNSFLTLWLFGFLISLILGQSITSPYKLADWWIEFSKWLQKRKIK